MISQISKPGLPWWRSWWTRWKSARASALSHALSATLAPEAALGGEQWAWTHLEEELRSPDLKLVSVRPLTRASRVFLVETESGLRLVWKSGEARAAREEAAYLLDRRLGHFGLVPPVVTREWEGVKGALRLYLGQARPAYLDSRSSYVLQTPERPNYYRMALLDTLLGNRDRHAGNWLLTPAGVVIPIDHGMAFPRRNGPQRFSAYDFHLKAQLAEADRQRLHTLLADWDGVRGEMLPLIGEEATNALFERVHGVLDHSGTYDWHQGALQSVGRQRTVRDTFEATFGARTNLDASHPEHGIHLSEPDDYQEVLQHIDVHRYYLCLERNADVSFEDASSSWFDAVYTPALEAIRAVGLPKEFPASTEADLYLWLAYHREKIKANKGWMPSERYVALFLADRFSGRPLKRMWKAVERSVRAALQAARESPRPPSMKAASSQPPN